MYLKALMNQKLLSLYPLVKYATLPELCLTAKQL